MDLVVSEVRLGDQRLFTGIVRDLSERKRMEAAVRRMEQLALMGRLASLQREAAQRALQPSCRRQLPRSHLGFPWY
jgi:hypothetical protein